MIFFPILFLHQSAPSGQLMPWLQVFPQCLKIRRAIKILKFIPIEAHNADENAFIRYNVIKQIF
jgi:hypothetical protein